MHRRLIILKSNLTRPILKHPLRSLMQMEMGKDVSKLYSSLKILVFIFKEKNTKRKTLRIIVLWSKVGLRRGNQRQRWKPCEENDGHNETREVGRACWMTCWIFLTPASLLLADPGSGLRSWGCRVVF